MDYRSRACKFSASLCSARSPASFPQFPDCTCYAGNIPKMLGKGDSFEVEETRFEIEIRAGGCEMRVRNLSLKEMGFYRQILSQDGG